MPLAKFRLGQVVRHRIYPFRGIIFDVDPVFNSTEEWWESIPEEIRPKKDQPFYHLLAENADTEYVAYVSEQNLLPDTTGTPTPMGATASASCNRIDFIESVATVESNRRLFIARRSAVLAPHTAIPVPFRTRRRRWLGSTARTDGIKLVAILSQPHDQKAAT
jgi:heat shock protein HspQ